MKRIVPAVAALVLLTLGTMRTASADPVSLMIDRAHSEMGFDVRHFFNKVHGRFNDFSGTISYDPKNIAASSVEVTIRDSSIFTANDRRDNHLRTQDFFWVEKYPTITFKSTKVTPGKDDTHFQVTGDFTLRGITKSITIDCEFLGMGTPASGGMAFGTQAGFIGTLTIPDRKEYGLTWNKTLDQGGVMLGDDVQITLNVAAISAGPGGPGGPPKK